MIKNKIKGLGEVILRVNNMEKMKNFYQEIIGLQLIQESENYTFFKIAEGYKGHNQTLALFAKTNLNAFNEKFEDINFKKSSLHHFALEIDKKDYDEILQLCKNFQLEHTTEKFDWIKWKSIFIKDPENNVIEFVCHDSNL
ncbi:VOC family protein [Christiangramia salexigens]|uniref:Glyoxalase n=1 Tax=Christiangramia salexigens TaxID=1913577 RepID=A0A1L3J408_9FLAO|nr:VOC family protein [Christiangramia salexigens]APG59842.1 glyoxalase [Christiangramia salexigens]